MKDRSRSVYDLDLLIVIVQCLWLLPRSLTVYSQNQTLRLRLKLQRPTVLPNAADAAVQVRHNSQPQSDADANQLVDRSDAEAFCLAQHRTGQHGRTHRRHRSVEQNPYIIYVGFATNGVWKSTNNGTTFQPIFDTYGTHSIGDIAIAPSDPNIVWVGTGEANNRQSSSFGDGIYKSVDAGKTFTKMGLEDSQTIARIVIDPKDPNIVYVAVLGHLFGPNKERGVYKTTDGGKTWNNVKFIDEDTGFTDLAMDASDSKILYAASYQRRRTSFGFNGGGQAAASGRLSMPARRGRNSKAAVCRKDSGPHRSRRFAFQSKHSLRTDGSGREYVGTGGEENTLADRRTESEPFPVRIAIAVSGSGGESRCFAYTPTPPDPKKPGVWRSDDKGKTWRVVSNENNRPMYYSQIRVDPKNPENVYVGGLNFSKSTDGGKTFKSLQQGIAHSDNHAIWINPG
jgi:hypothetical protein